MDDYNLSSQVRVEIRHRSITLQVEMRALVHIGSLNSEYLKNGETERKADFRFGRPENVARTAELWHVDRGRHLQDIP